MIKPNIYKDMEQNRKYNMNFKEFKKINESSPIESVISDFKKTEEYKLAKKAVDRIVSQLENDFYEWCENNGHAGADGETDYDLSFGVIRQELVSDDGKWWY